MTLCFAGATKTVAWRLGPVKCKKDHWKFQNIFILRSKNLKSFIFVGLKFHGFEFNYEFVEINTFWCAVKLKIACLKSNWFQLILEYLYFIIFIDVQVGLVFTTCLNKTNAMISAKLQSLISAVSVYNTWF